MPKYLDPAGTALLWSKIKNITKNNLIYYSKTTQQWNSDISFISQKNVLYLYMDYKTIEKDGSEVFIPGLKIGDGTTYLVDLPFLNDVSDFNQQILDHINNLSIHVSAADRIFWNNKLNLSQLQLDNENLILNRQ